MRTRVGFFLCKICFLQNKLTNPPLIWKPIKGNNDIALCFFVGSYVKYSFSYCIFLYFCSLLANN